MTETLPVTTGRISRGDRRSSSRARLINAAFEACADGRFFNSSIEDLSKSAEISRAGFYLHFKSKKELLDALMESQFSFYINQHSTVTPKQLSTKAGILRWLNLFVTGYKHSGEVWSHFWMNIPTKHALRLHQETRERVAQIIGHRYPALKIFNTDGSINVENKRELILFLFELEQVCLGVALEVWQGREGQAMLELLVSRFQSIVARAQTVDKRMLERS